MKIHDNSNNGTGVRQPETELSMKNDPFFMISK